MRDFEIRGKSIHCPVSLGLKSIGNEPKEKLSMSEKEKEEDENFIKFKKDIEGKKQTVLFIGAGVNCTKDRKMMWPDLLNYLMDYAKGRLDVSSYEREIITKALMEGKEDKEDNLRLKMKANQMFPSEVKASIIKHLLGDLYIPLLQDFLYGKDVNSELQKGCRQYVAGKGNNDNPFFSLFSIADFILRHDNIKSVVTYNYDNYLSSAINLLKDNADYKHRISHPIIPLDIYSGWKDKPFKNENFLIYHIHGMVQPNNEVAPHCSNQVVLSLEEYYDMARDAYSWHSATQLFYLTHYTCAFIGASLSDMTMQRVLHYANLKQSGENVYYLTAKTSDDKKQAAKTSNNKKQAEVLEKLKNSYLELLGLKVVYDTGYEELYKKMNQIA